jgi:glucose-6-phosphate isomerase
MLPSIDPVNTSSWSALTQHFEEIKNKSLLSLFKEEPNRFSDYSIEWEDFFVDFSKNHLTAETLALFSQLLSEVGLEEAKNAFFTGNKINQTEDRSVLHTALRNLSDHPVYVEGKDVMPLVTEELKKVEAFVNELHLGELRGYTGKPINQIVNIGIGGSDLGPNMVVKALKPYCKAEIASHFVSNVDASHIVEVLEQVDPETTLFIIASKTFTTQETMTNAHTARDWFMNTAINEEHIAKHFVAVSTNEQKVTEFGINPANMFVFWDWVGGRYSLWSTIGLSIACAIGYDHFHQLLAGAHEADNHFKEAELKENIPTMMAIVGVWYNNFFKCESQAILPYDHLLSYFSRYLQQGDMESNGKYISRSGKEVKYQTGPIIWGEPGTNGQHAFYQLIHQGTKMIPCDFIACAKPPHTYPDHHEKLIANFIAQTEALMTGKTEEQVVKELKEKGLSAEEIDSLKAHKIFKGNRPTTSILIKQLTPKALGKLIAIYEHKIFVQGVIWNILSFDQWGVELGKQLAGNVLSDITSQEVKNTHDQSTHQLINKYLDFRA